MFFRGVACCCYHTPGKRKKGRLCMKRPQNDMKCNLTLKGRPSGQTLPPSRRSCKVRHTAPQWHRYYPRTVSHVSETLRGQGAERRTLPLLGLGRVCSRRTQKAFGTAMRLCASLSRGVAAPLGCVIFLQFGDVALLWLSRRCLLYGVYCFRICRILRLLMTLHTFSRYS